MGRYAYHNTTGRSPSISVFWLNKHGYLKNGLHSGTLTYSWFGEKMGGIGITVNTELQTIWLSYTTITPKESFNYPVNLVTTPCNYGKFRYWFICPLTNCCRRVGMLYLPSGAKSYGCRHCYRLTYQSCQDSPGLNSLILKIGRQLRAGKNLKRKTKS